MATTTKKGSKNTKAKPRRAAVKTSLAKQAQTIAELRRELAESLQRENATAKELARRWSSRAATSEILRVIASRRPISNRCWMRLSRMRRGCVTRKTQ